MAVASATDRDCVAMGTANKGLKAYKELRPRIRSVFVRLPVCLELLL